MATFAPFWTLWLKITPAGWAELPSPTVSVAPEPMESDAVSSTTSAATRFDAESVVSAFTTATSVSAAEESSAIDEAGYGTMPFCAS